MDSLPSEIIFDLFMKLEITDLLNLCSTNSHISNICNDNTLWKYRTAQDFDDRASQVTKPSDMPWKQFYIQLYKDQLRLTDVLINNEIVGKIWISRTTTFLSIRNTLADLLKSLGNNNVMQSSVMFRVTGNLNFNDSDSPNKFGYYTYFKLYSYDFNPTDIFSNQKPMSLNRGDNVPYHIAYFGTRAEMIHDGMLQTAMNKYHLSFDDISVMDDDKLHVTVENRDSGFIDFFNGDFNITIIRYLNRDGTKYGGMNY